MLCYSIDTQAVIVYDYKMFKPKKDDKKINMYNKNLSFRDQV